jgi:hypothetical protein
MSKEIIPFPLIFFGREMWSVILQQECRVKVCDHRERNSVTSLELDMYRGAGEKCVVVSSMVFIPLQILLKDEKMTGD